MLGRRLELLVIDPLRHKTQLGCLFNEEVLVVPDIKYHPVKQHEEMPSFAGIVKQYDSAENILVIQELDSKKKYHIQYSRRNNSFTYAENNVPARLHWNHAVIKRFTSSGTL